MILTCAPGGHSPGAEYVVEHGVYHSETEGLEERAPRANIPSFDAREDAGL